MTAADSEAASANVRLFFGLPIPSEPTEILERWRSEHLDLPGVRALAPGHLHLTLAFLGARPVDEVERLIGALGEIADGRLRPSLRAQRYRETEHVAMVVFSDEEGRAGDLQASLSQRLERLGVYRPEKRPWLPHVTIARFRTRPRLRLVPPELGVVTPAAAALYQSKLTRAGAVYEVLAAVELAQSRDASDGTP